MGDRDRELDLLQNRQDAQGRRLDAAEASIDRHDVEYSKLDKAQAVVIVELGLLRDAVKSTRAWTGAAAVAVVGTAVGLVMFGGGR